MRSLLGTIVNRSPVPLEQSVSRRGSFFNIASRSASSVIAQTDAYRTVGTVHSVVERLYTSVARLDWHLYRKAASGKKEDRKEVVSHACIDLLKKPNKLHKDWASFVKSFQQQKELTGEANIIVGRMPGFPYPIDLWPTYKDRIEPEPDPYEMLKGWIYTSPEGERMPLELNELIRTIKPHPRDPFRGMSVIEAIMSDLDASRNAKEWQAAFYANSARPGGMIEVDRRLSDPEWDEMTSRWREQHQGVSKAHRVAILENGAKWVEAAITQRDMQYAELATLGRDVVLEGFGFPKGMLGIVEDVNRANAEAGEYMYGKWLIEPRADDIKDMLNNQLLPMYGETSKRLEWDYDSPVPENAEMDMRALTARWGAANIAIPLGFEPKKTLETLDLPDIPFEKPEPVAPPVPTEDDEEAEDYALAARFSQFLDSQIDAAMKWEAKECEDDNTCEPCKENQGRLYRNRKEAYEDYPNGEGYIHCVGAQFGNQCRGKVVRRRNSK